MAKKQAAPTNDNLALLARVFVRYRSGLDVNFSECQEIVRILSDAGIDALNMDNGDILTRARWVEPGEEYTISSTSFVEIEDEVSETVHFPDEDEAPDESGE